MSMSRIAGVTIGALLCVAGCDTTGLSMREADGRDYANMISSLYAEAPLDANAPRPVFAAPGRIAVAQVGEVAPPDLMIEKLRTKPALFSQVMGLPAVGATAGADRNGEPPAAGQERMVRLERMARDAGADYLIVFGGTIDHGQSGTPLSAADLTIVGAFVVPSQQTKAIARGSAAVIDLKSRRVVAMVDTSAEGSRFDSSAASEGGEQKLLGQLRDKVVLALADKVIEACGGRAARL